MAWRPSRWPAVALLVLGGMGAFCVVASGLPRALAWPLAAAALGHGAWLHARERRRPELSFVLRGDAAPVRIDGEAVKGFELHWRGPLAFASWRDREGRCQRRAWWPDTLSPAARRELRLAAPRAPAARDRGSMAP